MHVPVAGPHAPIDAPHMCGAHNSQVHRYAHTGEGCMADW